MVEYLVLLFTILLLNIIPNTWINRKKIIFPLSFLIITIFLAIRYDYGLDYWNYYSLFQGDYEGMNKGTGDFLFFKIMGIFPQYYQFVIFHTICWMMCLYYFVRKYVNFKYYILFFFLFLCIPGMFFILLSALRTTLAACVLWIACDLFYVRSDKKINLLWFCLLIAIASFIHTSAIVFLIIPICHLIMYNHINMMTFGLLCLCSVLSLFFTHNIYSFFYNNIDILSDYSIYAEVTMSGNFNNMIYNALFLFPAFYICKYYKYFSNRYKKITHIAILFFMIHLLGVNFQERFTAYLFIFVILSLSYTLNFLNKGNKIIALTPLIMRTIYSLVSYYGLMINETFRFLPGNYISYQTIFSAPYLP